MEGARAEKRIEFTVGGKRDDSAGFFHHEVPGLDGGARGRFIIKDRGEVYFSASRPDGQRSSEATYLGKFWVDGSGRLKSNHSNAHLTFKTESGKVIVPIIGIVEAKYLSGDLPKDAFPIRGDAASIGPQNGFLEQIRNFKAIEKIRHVETKIKKKLGLQK